MVAYVIQLEIKNINRINKNKFKNHGKNQNRLVFIRILFVLKIDQSKAWGFGMLGAK